MYLPTEDTDTTNRLQLNDNAVDKPPVVLFLHVPKAAGNTIYSVMKEQYSEGEVFIPFKTAAENWLAIERLTDEERSRIRAIGAHMDFGAHQFFHAADYFTILRDPVRRVVSSYCYSLGNPKDMGHKLIKDNNLDLAGFARLPNLNNVQTRYLRKHSTSGTDWELRPHKLGFIQAPFALADAKRTLDRCAIVGISEQLPTVLRLLEIRFGWKNIENRFENVTESEKQYPVLDDETRRIIEAENRCDIALYRYACKLFAKQCASYGLDIDPIPDKC